MPQRPIKRALISVYDKTGIVDFARALHSEFGIEIISTGGTAKTLKEAGIPVTLVEDITGFPEMLDGRVKTLHPKIHAAILADRDNPEHMRQLEEHGIKPIDMVVVNLYPFEKVTADPNCTFEQAIEMIDIGGVALLRAAAKNFKHVVPIIGYEVAYHVCLSIMRHSETPGVLHTGDLPHEAFLNTSRYDSEILTWISNKQFVQSGQYRAIHLCRLDDLKYGENPHQKARLYQIGQDPADRWGIQISSTATPMSMNNYIDADVAQDLLNDLSRMSDFNSPRPCCVFVKHNNACGVGTHDDPIEAYRRAYMGDPHAAMGGILAVNFVVERQFAERVMNTLDTWGRPVGAMAFFLEVWVAPSFLDDDVVHTIQATRPWGKNVRLLDIGGDEDPFSPELVSIKHISGMLLIQGRDVIGLNEDQWNVVTKRQPTGKELDDLRLAWLIAKHTKSNAISICKDGMLIGNGAGQMSRVMSCRIATWLAKENGHADKLPGSVAASDAFFPFRDGPDLLIDAGVTAIIQPGGSKRDADTIAACDERGVAMIFTGTRHFRH